LFGIAIIVWRDDHAAFHQRFVGVVWKYIGQMPPAFWGEAHGKYFGNLTSQASPFEVVDRTWVVFQCDLVAAGSLAHEVAKAVVLLAFGCGLGFIGWTGLFFRDIEAHLLCQVLHGFYKASAGVVH
jgi:hypothetical protein